MIAVRVMRRVRSAIVWAVPGLCAGLLAVPAVASTNGAGGAVAPTAPPNPSHIGHTPTAVPTATGGALTLTPTSLLVGQTAVATGTLPASNAGSAVQLQVRRSTRAWSTVARAVAARDGGFTISWRATTSGQLTLRVVSAPDTGTATTAASTAMATPQATLSVYSRVVATWYGPGLYGRHTACGETLSPTIVGVADRTLPCGTPVSLSYNGQTLVIPVIDRGPYTSGVTLDLTHAAAQELGITTTVSLGMLAVSGPPLAPTNFSPPGTPASPGSGAGGPAGTYAGGATAPTS